MSEPAAPVVAPGDEFRVWPAERTWFWVRMVVQSWYVPTSGLRVYGRERVPTEGPCVFAMNHIGALDPFVMGMASPRSIRYMAKTELFELPVVGRLMPHTGSFAVRRGESDREAIRMARDVIRAGHCLGIFVEGTRQETSAIGEVKTGAAMVAVAERVPVLPVCVQNAAPLPGRPFPASSVAFGAPIDFSDLPRGARGYRLAAHTIRLNLESLRDFLRSAERAGRPHTAVPPVSTPAEEHPHGRP